MSESLSRERIVRATVELIERDGPDEVSMRRIASEVDAGVMSLYNHVSSKSALFDAVAEHILTELEFSTDPDVEWPDQARALMRTLRAIGQRYPRSVNLVVSRLPGTAAGMVPVERALATARAAGFEGRAAVNVMRAFVNFALGCLVHEAARSAHAVAPGLDTLPEHLVNVRELLPELSAYDADAEFEFGMEMLIGALRRTGPCCATA